jgi:hypothetical protein
MHGRARIVDGGARDQEWVSIALLHLDSRIGASGLRVEFTARECRRNGDLAHDGRIVVRQVAAAVFVCNHSKPFKLIHLADIVSNANLHYFPGIRKRSAPECDDDVCAEVTSFHRRIDHRVTRCMRWHVVVYAHTELTELGADFVDFVSRAVHRAADQQEYALRPKPNDFLMQGACDRDAVDYSLDGGEIEASGEYHRQFLS